MTQLLKMTLPALGVGVLAVLPPSVPSGQAIAQRNVPVTVTNTPLPTTVTNTPSVTISGTPTVSFSNTSSTPLFVRDVDSPSLQPFARDCGIDTFDTAGRGSCSLEAVPAGKRWVVETVSGQLTISDGTKPISIHLALCSAGFSTDNFLPAVFQGNSAFFTGDFFTLTERVRLYADNTGGCHGAPFFSAVISNSTVGSAYFAVSGYLVNVP